MNRIARTSLSRRSLLGGIMSSTAASSFAIAQGREKVTFGTSWLAQAEHGGYYQALADGTYDRFGLDVTILPGGPQNNNRRLLSAGRIDFCMGSNLLQAFSAVEQNIPTVVVAAMFQKDPQVLIAHPGQGIEQFSDLQTLPTLFISKEGAISYFQWLKKDYGFRDEQLKLYTFNPQPFIADKRSAMQGYLTSEPFSIQRMAGFQPKVFLLADYGYDTYASTIETTSRLVKERPATCQKFIEASIAGWYNYLYADNSAANALIKKHNTEISDDAIAYAVGQIKAQGIVDSNQTNISGIGAMDEARVKSFFDRMVRAGVQTPAIDWRHAVDTRFVNKGFGMELRRPI